MNSNSAWNGFIMANGNQVNGTVVLETGFPKEFGLVRV